VEGTDDLVLFAAVVAAGGFSGASRALGIPKSRVSRRIAELERRLGVRLLQRSTRTVKVTDIGMEFYQRCEVVAGAARAALEVAENAQLDKHRQTAARSFGQWADEWLAEENRESQTRQDRRGARPQGHRGA